MIKGDSKDYNLLAKWVGEMNPKDFYLTLDKKETRNLRISLEYEGPIKAPIQKDQKLASLIVFNKDEVIKSIPLYSLEKISKVNFFKSLFTSLNYLIWGDV